MIDKPDPISLGMPLIQSMPVMLRLSKVDREVENSCSLPSPSLAGLIPGKLVQGRGVGQLPYISAVLGRWGIAWPS